MLTLGSAIRIVRTATGTSASDACKLARVSAPMWSLIEQDKRQPAHDSLLRIAKALRCPCDVFLMVLGISVDTTDEVRGILKAISEVSKAEANLRRVLEKH
jgi:transcriptional regulator with XRE-family HTH domain